jgi:hypothetical protein
MKKLDNESLGIILLNPFMDEFFPTEIRSTPDTFPLFHYNGLPRSCPNGKVFFSKHSDAIEYSINFTFRLSTLKDRL